MAISLVFILLPKEPTKGKIIIGTIQGGISTLDLIEGRVSWIDVIRFDKSLDLAQALSKGEVDAALITSEMYAKFALKDKDLKIVAADMLQNQAIVGVKDLNELKGKKLGATTASGTYAMFLSYVKLAGLSSDEIRVVDAPPLQLVQAFERGDVDAVLCWEPLVSKLIVRGYEYLDFINLSKEYAGGDVVMLVWVAREEILAKQELRDLLSLRNDVTAKWSHEAPQAFKKLYGLSDEEIRVLLSRVKVLRGDLREYEDEIVAAWKLALMGGYIEGDDNSLEELKSRAFWEG
ncbi:MAG: ABC transporter substrate-binding protein [Candidatus Korarchaeum sp.]|nr:ABC transporter substrate-binding protein [Candidatus Korarchaeum sp.]